jgi:hypothetical protein
VCAMHGRVVAEAHPILEQGRLSRVHVQAAQILDVALGADDNLGVIGTQHRAVPDRGRTAQRYPADNHRAWCYPGIRVHRRRGTVQRPDKAFGMHESDHSPWGLRTGCAPPDCRTGGSGASVHRRQRPAWPGNDMDSQYSLGKRDK